MAEKEFMTGVDPKPFARYCTVYKSAKKKELSFRLTRRFLTKIWDMAAEIRKIPRIILTIPANMKENYVIECVVTKERKI